MFESILGKSRSRGIDEESHWLSVSDLMAGLMIVFLFISIVLMRSALIERDKIKEIAAAYQDNKVSIYEALMAEFEKDLMQWKAEIKKDDLSFNFKSPEILFGRGELTLKPKFKAILNIFFPRYLKIVSQFNKSIQEIRIEGHTSSTWNTLTSEDEAYFKNMALSQGRTRSVLAYIYQLKNPYLDKHWIKSKIAAVGYSSSKLVYNYGIEDKEQSRRVSFRIITNSETQILKIIQ